MTWMQTRSGVAVDLLNPQEEDIHLPDIAYALARINRFTGHGKRFYSVAQHSVLIAQHLLLTTGERDLALGGLLHDAAEAYLGDISSPLKAALRLLNNSTYSPLKDLESRVDHAICLHLRVTKASLHDPRVKEADLAILRTEKELLMRPAPRPWGITRDALPVLIKHNTFHEDERAFIELFDQLKWGCAQCDG